MGKLKDANKKIEKTVVGGYKKVEDTVVNGYKKVEDESENNPEYLVKERVKKEQKELAKKSEELINGGR